MHYRVLTVEQAEEENPGDPVGAEPAKPFGGVSGQWEQLKAAARPGDKVVAFVSPIEAWQASAGRSGVALRRDGRIVMEVVTMSN